MGDMLTWQMGVALGVVFMAGIMRGFTGFGAAMLIMPVYSILFHPTQAVATMVCLSTISTVQILPGVMKIVRWKVVIPISLAALVTIPVGTLILLNLTPELMRRGISAIILLSVLLLMSGWRLQKRPGLLGGIMAGGLSGVINGATATGGPPVVLYMLAGPDSAEINRANLIGYFMLLYLATLINFIPQGLVRAETIWRVVILAPVFILAQMIGTRLFSRSTDIFSRRFALLVLLGVSLVGLLFP